METKIKPLTKAQAAAAEREEFAAKLRAIIKPGDAVYTVQERRGRGTTRYVSLLLPRIADDGKPYIQNITYWAGKAMGSPLNDGQLSFGGWGYSATFQAVYNLGRALWPDGDGKYTRHRNGDAGPETDGGYMLSQSGL